MNDKNHASLGDLPSWSSPITIREIPNVLGSWGMAVVYTGTAHSATIVHDERGLLWLDGNAKPIPEFITGSGVPNNKALIFHHEGGIGVYLPKLAYKDVPMISDRQLKNYKSGEESRYVPVNRIVGVEDIPEGMYADDPTTRKLLAERKKLVAEVSLESTEVAGER